MPRALFEKTGNAVWMSHLDLMRVFQRAFKRAGLNLKHTQGFNPRPSVSIALPLSVGVQSRCELLDFDLDGQNVSCAEICRLLNECLVSGVRVLEVYEDGRKIRDLNLLECKVWLEYDGGVHTDAHMAISQLFAQPSLVVEKKSKNGITEQDIIPMLRRCEVSQLDAHTLQLHATLCCQNPTLNPMQLVAAIEKYLPPYMPDHARYCRVEIYDAEETIFR